MKPFMRQNKKSKFRTVMSLVLLAVLGFFVLTAKPKESQALCPCSCVQQAHEVTRDLIRKSHNFTRGYIKNEFQNHQLWFLHYLFQEFILPSMQMMTEQLTAVGMHQMLILGTFLDAQQLVEVQQLYWTKRAQAHKDYHPSVGMCEFGTLTRNLAHAEPLMQLTSYTLAKRSLDRQLGHEAASSAEGPETDVGASTDVAGTIPPQTRMEQFIARYCDNRDNKGDLDHICTNSAPERTRDRDVDYTTLVDHPRTLNIDFSGNVNIPDEENDGIDVLALSSNLYGHRTFTRMSRGSIANQESDDEITDMRSLIAKRSVAENSFAAIVALKTRTPTQTAGAGGFRTLDYMRRVLAQLNVEAEGNPNTLPDDEFEYFLGENPSYYAQMELISQRVFQNPSFYTNLYDKPANVERKKVAMQAIDLMLDRDIYRSELRMEALYAVLLEMEALKFQQDVDNRIGRLNAADKQKQATTPAPPNP